MAERWPADWAAAVERVLDCRAVAARTSVKHGKDMAEGTALRVEVNLLREFVRRAAQADPEVVSIAETLLKLVNR